MLINQVDTLVELEDFKDLPMGLKQDGISMVDEEDEDFDDYDDEDEDLDDEDYDDYDDDEEDRKSVV